MGTREARAETSQPRSAQTATQGTTLDQKSPGGRTAPWPFCTSASGRPPAGTCSHGEGTLTPPSSLTCSPRLSLCNICLVSPLRTFPPRDSGLVAPRHVGSSQTRDQTHVPCIGTVVCLVKAMVYPVVTCGCESQTIKKAECQRTDAFELWCWRRLLRVPWTARRSNQAILKEINPEYSLEGLMLKLQYLGHLIRRAN